MKTLQAFVGLLGLIGCGTSQQNPTPTLNNSLSLSIRGKEHESLSALPGTKLVLSLFGGERADGSEYELENVSQVRFVIAWKNEYWEVTADLADKQQVELSIHTRLREFSSSIGWEGTGQNRGKLTIRKYHPKDKVPFETVVQKDRKTVVTPLRGRTGGK